MGAQMSFEDFLESTNTSQVPRGLVVPLRALWYDARGDWAKAHQLAQSMDNESGAWVHAYLHRKEGDEMNAGYWYARARRPAATGELAAEWEAIARELVGG
jgi:hypothetical protein